MQKIPERFRSVFEYERLNAIQERTFSRLFHSTDRNVIISAPTGSGKTGCMDLALCAALGGGHIAAYVAPTKALCAEREADWTKRFGRIGKQCVCYTGDNSDSISSSSDIMIFTPEKLDALTRRWCEVREAFQRVQLLLIDELHMVRCPERGPCLETVIIRLRTFIPGLRLVGVSASIGNTIDFCKWLSNHDSSPATGFSFGEDFRPTKLERHVIGYPKRASNGDFMFEAGLNQYLPELIKKYSDDRPVLVFCSTRKSAVKTAEYLATKCGKYISTIGLTDEIKDTALAKCCKNSVAFHHAGLSAEDKAQVEQLFRTNITRVVCCTSTLAVGLNLPARLVIIKSTSQYSGNSGFTSYDDADILQMIGRAGRPGHDSHGVAVIMTDMDRVKHYESVCSANSIIDSHFHELKFLIGNLTSEIVLGNVYDRESALSFIQSSFFHIRAHKDFTKYGIVDKNSVIGYEIGLYEKVIQILIHNGVLGPAIPVDDMEIRPTIQARVMSKYYLRPDTIQRLESTFESNPEGRTGRLLMDITQVTEYEEQRITGLNKSIIEQVRKNPCTRYSDGNDIFHLLQLFLGEYDDLSIRSAVFQYIEKLAERAMMLLKALLDIALYKKNWKVVKTAVELVAQITCKTWNDTPKCLMQLHGVGKAHARSLARAGLQTIESIRGCSPSRLEVILRRHSPFGQQLIGEANKLPRISEFNLNGEWLKLKIESESSCQGHVLLIDGDVFKHIVFRGSKYSLDHSIRGFSQIQVLFETHCGVDYIHSLEDASKMPVSATSTEKPIEYPMTPVSNRKLTTAPNTRNVQESPSKIKSGSHQSQLETLQQNDECKNGERRMIVSVKRQNTEPHVGCKHRCRSKLMCGHECCKKNSAPPDNSLSHPSREADHKEWLASFSYKGPRADLALPLMPKPSIEIESGYTRKEMDAFKRESQDSLHSILEALGY